MAIFISLKKTFFTIYLPIHERLDKEQGKYKNMRNIRNINIDDIIGSLPVKKESYRAVPLPDPSAKDIYEQSRRMLEDIAQRPDSLIGVINANYSRLKSGDIDPVFPDKRATAWLRAMHMLTEVAARLYEQNPYEFNQLERVANSLNVFEDYIRKNRHCPQELLPVNVDDGAQETDRSLN